MCNSVKTILVTAVLAACSSSATPSSTEPTLDGRGNACAVKHINNITPTVGGFSVSPIDHAIFAVTRPVKGLSSVFVHDRRTGHETCITCSEAVGAPGPDQHAGVPSFFPDGQHMALQVEMAEHPLQDRTGDVGSGWFNNLWVTTLSGDRWWPLTDYPHGPNDRYGALLPQVSSDGKKLAWAELYKPDPTAQLKYLKGQNVSGGAPWGHWRIRIADIIWTDIGPELANNQIVQPEGATFFETQAWSRDGRRLLFASDLNRATPHAMDLWWLDIASGETSPATDRPDAWIEFGSLSPDGTKLVFMSSQCCGFDPEKDSKKKLRAEIYLKDIGESTTHRLTHFNKRGYPESIPLGGSATTVKMTWGTNGRKLYFELPFYGLGGKPRGAWLKELEFEGACGGAGD